MKLNLSSSWNDEFKCELTDELDKLANLNYEETFLYHYILADEFCRGKKCLAIRVPGGTIGGLWVDDNNVITRLEIDTNYVVDSYPDNVNELVQKYIGQTIEFNDKGEKL